MDRKERLESREFRTPWKAWITSFNPKRMIIAYWAFFLIHLSYFIPLSIKNIFIRLTAIKIGRGSLIAPTTGLDFYYPEKLEIGRNCVIGYDATVLAHEITTEGIRYGKTEIGDNVLIGANSTILPGVKIQDEATVASGAVVTGDVGEGQKVGGVPAQPIGERSEGREKSE